jgi:hypothetical protein
MHFPSPLKPLRFIRCLSDNRNIHSYKIILSFVFLCMQDVAYVLQNLQLLLYLTFHQWPSYIGYSSTARAKEISFYIFEAKRFLTGCFKTRFTVSFSTKCRVFRKAIFFVSCNIHSSQKACSEIQISKPKFKRWVTFIQE